jgi:hypothetical protein
MVACRPSDPIERTAEARAGYGAELTGFYAKQVEIAPAAGDVLLMEEGAGAEDAAAEEVNVEERAEGAETEAAGAEGAEGESGEGEAVEVPTRTDLVLDVLVSRQGSDELQGLTLDITLVDASQAEKEHWLWWVDTSGMPKGDQRQFSHTLQDVDYVEGDGLLVEVRDPVPAQVRGDYREFREGADG